MGQPVLALDAAPPVLAVRLAEKGWSTFATYDWMAFQDGDRPWQVLDPAREAWELPVQDPGGRYALAWVQVPAKAQGLGVQVEVLCGHLGADPLIQLPRPEGTPPAPAAATPTLHFRNVPDHAVLAVGSHVPGMTENFLGMYVPDAPNLDSPGQPVFPGSQDVTVVQCRQVQPTTGLVPEKALLVRGFDPTHSPGGLLLDLALAAPVETYSVPLEGIGCADLGKGAGVDTAGERLYGDPTPDPTRIQGFHLPWDLPAGLTYATFALVNHPIEGGWVTTWVDASHHQVPPTRLTMPAPLKGMTFQVEAPAGAPPQVAATAPATSAWDGFSVVASRQQGLGQPSIWTVSARADPNGPTRVEFPALHHLPGWQAAWNLETTPFLTITMTAFKCNLPWEHGCAPSLGGNRDGCIMERSQSSYTWPPWDERPR